MGSETKGELPVTAFSIVGSLVYLYVVLRWKRNFANVAILAFLRR